MCTGQPCVVAQPHCGGIMGVRMGVVLGGVGCMMWELFIHLYRFSKYCIMFHLHICEDSLHMLLMLLATLDETHTNYMFPEYELTMARDLYNIGEH